MRPLLVVLAAMLLLISSGCQTATSPGQKERDAHPQDRTSPLAGRDTPRHRVLYYLQHRLLPYLWMNFSQELHQALSDYGAAHLIVILKMAEDDVGMELGERPAFAIELLDLAGEAQGWLLTMPEPRVTTECAFTALIFDGERLRYLTYEFGFFESEYWVLGEVTDGRRLNYGPGGDGSRKAFIERILALMKSENRQAGEDATRGEG